MPLASVQRLRTALDAVGVTVDTRAGGASLANPVDAVWSDRPPPPCAPLTPLPARVTGESAASKLARARAALTSAAADALVVTALDEVAWLFNVRGADVECNPVAVAYAVVHAAGGAELYVDAAKLDEAARAHLADAAVAVRPYEALAADLAALRGRVWIDPCATNYAVYEALAARKAAIVEPAPAPAAAAIVEPAPAAAATAATTAPPTTIAPPPPPPPTILQQLSPLQLMTAIKSEREVAGMRAAHVRDAVALVSFFAWLEAAVLRGVDLRRPAAAAAAAAPLAAPLTEHSLCEVLEGFRAAQADHVGPSFPTIAGFGANGAIIHYRPEPGSAAPLGAGAVFLCDSGAQYLDGTTDVTRTLHFGAPSAHERRAYTRVLQGHLALARALPRWRERRRARRHCARAAVGRLARLRARDGARRGGLPQRA